MNLFCDFRRNEKLSKLNLALREQLEESQKTNESLTNDLQKLACDWQQMRDEMVEKEEEWKEEEQVSRVDFDCVVYVDNVWNNIILRLVFQRVLQYGA